jgi:hypothetical protein
MSGSGVSISTALKGVHSLVELANKKTRQSNKIISEKQHTIDTTARKALELSREVKRLQKERDDKLVGKDIDFLEQMKQIIILDEIIDKVSTLTPEENAELYELMGKK